jgi:hypothetical protein
MPEYLGGNCLRIQYVQTDTWTKEETDFDYKVPLTTTRCNFGGIRYWFVCPLVVNGKPCRRRVAKLYKPPNAKYFGRRHCHDLTYTSCQEHDKRVDALVRNPALLTARMSSDNVKDALLAMKAYDKIRSKPKVRK